VISSAELGCPSRSRTFILQFVVFLKIYATKRDYVAHPRNPNGIIRRKIKNEFELVEKTKTWFPNYKIRGVQMDKLPMKEQIFLITKTNILIGMHGAGLSHALFLSKGSGIIELSICTPRIL
jgi:glycoprotein 2-beta-D-xylosyltransferase